MKMSAKQLEKWTKIRQMGRKRFVLRFWVLGWGVTTALVWAMMMAYLKGWSQLPMFLALALVGFPVGGIFLGRWMWRINERKAAEAVR